MLNFCTAAVTLATYLTPWSVTLNNHMLAACTGLFALHAALRIWYDGRRQWYWFALAGFFSAFTAGIELPAGLLAVSLCAALLIKDYKRTLLFGLLPAALPVVAALYTNHLVTGQWLPAYTEVNKAGGFYDYPGSYWREPAGVDALNEPKALYLANILAGHDGFFLLTPIHLLGLVGAVRHLTRRVAGWPLLAGFMLLLTAAVLAVYAVTTSNYGGGCQGFRWLFWLIPLWLLFLPSGVEPLARQRLGRACCYVLLAVSLFSVGFALTNPWSSSWARLLFQQLGWISY